MSQSQIQPENEAERDVYRMLCLNTLVDTCRDPDGQVTRHWHNGHTWREAARENISLSVKWKQSGSEEIVLTSREINRSGWLSEEWMQDEGRRSAARGGMEWYGREVPPTLAGGGKTGGRMCSRVVAVGPTAIDVLTAGEGQMATGGMFVEPQLPMTHLQAMETNHQWSRGIERIGFWLTVDDRSAEVGAGGTSTSFKFVRESDQSERETHRGMSRSARSKTRKGQEETAPARV